MAWCLSHFRAEEEVAGGRRPPATPGLSPPPSASTAPPPGRSRRFSGAILGALLGVAILGGLVGFAADRWLTSGGLKPALVSAPTLAARPTVGPARPPRPPCPSLPRPARPIQPSSRSHVDPRVIAYAATLVDASRHPAAHGLDQLARVIQFGASPLASINLVAGARALAFLRGRGYVLAKDVADRCRPPQRSARNGAA